MVFGRLTAVRVRGDAGPSEKIVAGYLEKLTTQDVFNTNLAERYLLLADDLLEFFNRVWHSYLAGR